MGIYLWAFRK